MERKLSVDQVKEVEDDLKTTPDRPPFSPLIPEKNEMERKLSVDQVKEVEEDLRTTPDRTPFSPLIPEKNEMCGDSQSTEFKTEPPESVQNLNIQMTGNSVQFISTENLEKSPERQPLSPLIPETNEICGDSNSNEMKNEAPDIEKHFNIQMTESTVQLMSTEILEQCPEQPSCSIIPETNIMCNDSKSNEVKKESPNSKENLNTPMTGNTVRPISPDTSENSPQITEGEENNLLETNKVVVKEEPVNEEVDCIMPIAKTPHKTSASHISDMDNTLLRTITNIANERGSTTNIRLEENADSAALNAYLDGMATPIAPVRPRLRVKMEFAFPKTPQREPSPENDFLNKDDAMDTDNLRPPPPPSLSSNTSSDFLADGIATPKISLAAISRLRVKTEFSLPPATSPHHINEDILGEVLVNHGQDKEAGEVSASEDEASEDEPIPDNFFDDLLRDKIKERIQDAQNNDLEEKYSDRLKELERLQNELKKADEKSKERRKNRKKQKKSKKKSRKRSRSRSLSPSSSKAKERNPNDLSSHEHDRNKRIRVSPSRNEMASSSNYVHNDAINATCLRVNAGFRIKSEFPENNAKESDTLIENVEENDEVLTPKQRRERAVKRATALLNYLKASSGDNSTIFSTFPFVSTVRKLPTSQSYVQQQVYENRSPLHTVNNVSYKFNSHTIRYNLEEWGLAALPTHAAKMAKLVGCNAQFIYNKLKTIKIPAKLKKIKQEPNKETVNEEEELIETNSSLYSNAMTQTDDASEFDMPPKKKGYEIGVQAEPNVYSIGCQTLETQSPTQNLHKDDEAPIMKIIHDLNENQLMAIHAFAELINEPNTSANAMEMYKIQMKILDIYKMSQIPSALVTAQSPIVNNYTTMTAMQREPPQLCIQSVKGADGKQFSVNDPRSKSMAYTKRDHRHSDFSQSTHGRPLPNVGYSQPSYSRSSGNEARHYSNNSPSSRQLQNPVYSGQPPPTTTKHYGRGAARR